MLRSHTCGELTEKDLDKQVKLCGWVNVRRDHGSVIFIDLRDRWGIIQIIFGKNPQELHAIAKELRPEDVILVKGKVGKRPKGTENSRLATGYIEVIAEELEILNSAQTPPIDVSSDSGNFSEEVRLAYRFIDLRRPSMQKKLILRHVVCNIMRNFLDKEGFVEVETPILTKSTPEGARDFLVPSRLNPGMFYALPQSPQLFKQILMVSGFDRYFQLARCFRDEDLRADRQPEFTQLDIEMSFVDEEDIFSLTERLMRAIFKDSIGYELKIPFERISFNEAIKKYGSDKPDVRKDKSKNVFELIWVIDFPLFRYNEEEKRWEAEHHPFTAPRKEDIDLIEKHPEKVRARAYDLVINGVEIGSGSIRNHDPNVQMKVFNAIGMDKRQIEQRFGFLMNALKFGAPPHGGIAPGLDRLIAILLGEESIREVIAFPKTQKAVCPLTNAPSTIEEKQLKEIGLKINPNVKIPA